MASDDMNDPDLKAAIAASLGETNSSEDAFNASKRQDVIDLTGESDDPGDDDPDLKRAIELSIQGTGAEPGPSSDNTPSNERPMGLLGLDRKQMEQERVARLAKRKPEDASPLGEPEPKQQRTETPARDASYRDTVVGASNRPIELDEPTDNHSGNSQIRQPSTKPEVQFPDGVVKKTWAWGCDRKGDDIKLEEVFQKSDIDLAILSSFMWDMDWLFSKLDTKNSRFLLMMQAKDEHTKRQYLEETESMTNLRLCFPPMPGQVNCMHSKLMLIFHPEYVRIVVPTANLTPYDWGEKGGIMENTVFLIDLPKMAEGDSQKMTHFYKSLVYYLRATTLHENIISKLAGFDFRKTANLAFVHTIGGSHPDKEWRHTGYCGMGRSLKHLGLQSPHQLNIDFVSSSLGALSNEFLRSIYLAAQGDDGLTELVLRTANSFPAKNLNDPNKLIEKDAAAEWAGRFRAYFPSKESIENSKGGKSNAGTICFQQKWFDGPRFPRHVMRDCSSVRPGLMMHNKIMFVRPDEPLTMKDGTLCHAWAYVGSANLSESAWGRLVVDRATRSPKLNCRNWECGVIVPVIEKAQSNEGDHVEREIGDSDPIDVFKGTVPVPMRVPGRRFMPGVRPWYFLTD